MSETPMTFAACGKVLVRESLSVHPAAEEAARPNRRGRFDPPAEGRGLVSSIAERLKKVFRG
jgi:hypothetical protein